MERVLIPASAGSVIPPPPPRAPFCHLMCRRLCLMKTCHFDSLACLLIVIGYRDVNASRFNCREGFLTGEIRLFSVGNIARSSGRVTPLMDFLWVLNLVRFQ